MRVTVIDYKAGNLTSVLKTLRHLGAETVVTDGDLALVEAAERIVLPGVGHFAATERLDATGLTGAIRAAIARGVPFLGICVGMQWLYAGSTEAPEQPGLGHFPESCTRFAESAEKVPHVGWNSLEVRETGSRLLAGVEPGEYVYFTHSYKGPVTADTAAVTQYIEPFAAAVERGNVMGVQFHPEKSGETGLKILRNFLVEAKGAHADQTHHRLPRRARGPRGEGRAVCRPGGCGRSGDAGGAPCARRRGRDCAAGHYGDARGPADAARYGAAHGAGAVCSVLRGRRHQVGARCGAGVRGGRGQGEHQLRGAGRSQR